ncbi:MAG: hypothetical protein A2161_12425 [Candidatus Schekmanbacteria bacterium RBG_13_48_7]|uniref:THIF-type NAD/FAD binding fold domain-containing protein n=1 Tax=Candidatus Schekmanbacteria bacterium RBG_13_48_7 TaxID=1817878 RepID=A0A1F7RKG1_9BACT|nr:MAG: hypothetical protein A2161_12425 [Candidatus Schekmanbacteria bacterium RBG_13_48_7]
MKRINKKISDAKILIAGAGGLGSPAAIILANAGVRYIGIADYDHVELSNLQRQILHTTTRVGKLKTESSRETLKNIFPDLHVELHSERLSAKNILKIIDGYDLVIDGVDNFSTRYLLNDACYFAKIPMIEGGVGQFEGQVTVFFPDESPCLRCIFPEPPPEGIVPTCHEAGVLGPVAGAVGSFQAWEAIKFFTEDGVSLIGKLWIFDALPLEIRIIRWPRNENCALCGSNPTIITLESMKYSCDVF